MKGAIAPIVTVEPSRVTPPRPARASKSVLAGLSRPAAMSGITIVPPPITVTPAPSPKAETASSGDAGRRTSVTAVMEGRV